MIKFLSDPRQSLQIAGVLIALGLIAEAVTLFFAHPIAFMSFILIGGTLIGLGVVLYLWTLFSTPPQGTD